MNKRVEPRFKTDTGVTLQLPNQVQPCPARMVDVSGTGFRLLVEKPIAVGEILQISVEDRRLLVSVRHCGPAENGYYVGVERIDKWMPGEEQDDAAVLGRPQIRKDVDPLRVIGIRNQFSKPSAAAAKTDPRRKMMLGGVGAVIGLSVLALMWGGMRGSGHTAATLPVVEKPVAKSVAVAPKKAAAKKAPAAVVLPAKPASVAGVQQVSLRASELSWVDACADGRVVFAKAFSTGETQQLKFSNVATVRTGNAGGLEITFGAKPAERMGQKGVIQMWKFTGAGRQEVPQNSASACTLH